MKMILTQFEEYLKKTQKSGSKKHKKYPRYVLGAAEIVMGGETYFDRVVHSSDLSEQLSACDGLLSGLDRLIDDTAYTGSKGSLKSYKTAVKAFKKFLERGAAYLPLAPVRKAKPIGKPSSEKKDRVKKKHSPCLGVELGADDDTRNVTYCNEVRSGGYTRCVPVPMDRRVPELAEFIEFIYPKIIDFARGVLSLPEENYKKLPVFLSTDCPVDVWQKSDEYLVREVKELLMNSDRPTTTEDIRSILDDPYFYDRRVGQFKYKLTDAHIVIYYMNFDTSDRGEFFAMVANVLSHEYMHYLQYAYCRDRGVADPFRGRHATTVSEAMAEFFAELFSVSLGGTFDVSVAEGRYNAWIRREGSGWPYANALLFHSVRGNFIPFSLVLNDYFYDGRVNKLCQVFDMSMRPADAYDLLKNI